MNGAGDTFSKGTRAMNGIGGTFAQRTKAVLDSPSDRLDHMVIAAELDPSADLRYGNWRDFDLSGADLRGFNFTGADLTGARFDNAFIAGAIFDHAIYDPTSLRSAADYEEFELTQPKVSARMNRLQEFLRDPSFKRDRRNIMLAPKRHGHLAHAERLISQLYDMIEAIGGRSSMRGLVRLGAEESIVHTWLPTLFTRVKAAYPDLEFEVEVDVSPSLRNHLAARDLDLAFLIGPIDNRDVHSCELCTFPVAFVANDRIRDEIGSPHEPIPLERIAEYDLATFSRNTQPYMALRELLFREGLHPRIHASASLEIVVHMALDGHAIAVIPPAILENKVEAREKLHILNTAINLPDLKFLASWPGGSKYRAAAKVAKIAVEVATSAYRHI